MTDRIDLDDLETGTDEGEAETGNRGDWLWRDDGPSAPTDEFESPATATAGDTAPGESGETDGDTTPGDATDGDTPADESDGRDRAPAPHVPNTGESTPVGIPTEGSESSGGASNTAAGSTAASSERDAASLHPMGEGTADEANEGATASGPHGGGADEMTTAVTYGALRRLEHPAAVVADAAQWSDWVGIVGDVPAHVIQKFQRDRGIDVDFFNGTGAGPGERLAEIDRNSMFYADRMVVVGREGADEPVAEAAGWEFVPLETAAAKADWELEDGDG